MRGRHSVRAILISAIAVLVGCGIDIDETPRDIAVDERRDLTDTGSVDLTPPVGGRRIFLVTGDGSTSLLRSVSRDVGSSPAEMLTALLGGPTTSEQNSGLRTAIPAGTLLIGVGFVAQGTLEIDVSRAIFDATGDALIDAVAQLVYTAREIDGVIDVVIRVDGAVQRWPRGDGSLDDGPLTIYDYPDRVFTTQPDFPGI
jgi:hypothetical protein